LHIKGWVHSSLLDYPGRIAASLFCGGCNFRCPNCHNSHLVLRPDDSPDIPEAEIWALLRKRRGLLDGVVLSGGEPTLQVNLLPFATRLRERGFLVKLDTNGYRPDVMRAMIKEGAVDYVAMDVKAPLEHYALAVGVPVDVSRIRQSMELLLDGRVEYEFRTTVVPGILAEDDIVQIAQEIAGASRYFLQQFVPRDTLDPDMLRRAPYPSHQVLAMADLARRWVDHVDVRGV
jgi:pyruvate formate lyase activating enzyme